ncbi:methyl-accepting chemotaxis protein [Providencia rettgeri]|nr:methyl-accepting chemotaxis protein [Providencia rettgeri]EIU9517243.1 methyl-accepting chemotaxis protein [Providencia rettgeri]ELR5093813.1 methyl-accepting chemotaxis protein [Providencia rettgeri]
MQKLRDYSIRTAVFVLLSILCLILGGTNVYSGWSLSRIADGNDIDRQLVQQMTVLSQGNDQYFRFVTRLTRVMESKSEGKTVDYAPVKEALSNMEKYLEQMKSISPGPMDPEISEQVIYSWQALFDDGVTPQLMLSMDNDPNKYLAHAHNITPALSRAFGASIQKFNQTADALISHTRQHVDNLMDITRIVMIITAILGILMLIFTDRYMATMMQKPLGVLRQHFIEIAKGNLSQPVLPFGNNCVGRLFPILEEMRKDLHESVGSIRQGSENIYLGASEISNGNNDLSSRTEEQAAALEETAASMEQITAAVQLNMENTLHANHLASEASVVANKGNEIVYSVVTTMSEISQSSQKISDIISMMNDISFQTNILALNASIEAARAGVHGRGFMVVAAEVRKLASHSADAAMEIEKLIASSGACVEKGTGLVNEMGKTMESILRGINEVTAIMKQITVASEEQSKGIAQVGVAITQMDSVTQQNASLVEQVATAANSLSQQTQELQQSVQQFNLSA